MSWMVGERYSDVASRPTLGRRAVRPSVARLQSPGAGSGLETKRSALGTHLSVDTYEHTRRLHCCTAAVSQKKCSKKWNTKYQDRFALAHLLVTSLCRQTRGSQPRLARLDLTRRAAHPTRLLAAPNQKNSSWSQRLLESLHTQ